MKRRSWWILFPALLALGLVALGATFGAAKADEPYKTEWQKSFEDFCGRVPAECAPYESDDDAVLITPETFSELTKVNKEVNHEFKYLDDQKHYDKREYWSYPQHGYADCEDFALEKRRRLVEKYEWARETLSIAVVAPAGFPYFVTELHAVLLVRTTNGYLLLDSIQDEKGEPDDDVREFKTTDYKLFSIQSARDPRRWDHKIDWQALDEFLARMGVE